MNITDDYDRWALINGFKIHKHGNIYSLYVYIKQSSILNEHACEHVQRCIVSYRARHIALSQLPHHISRPLEPNLQVLHLKASGAQIKRENNGRNKVGWALLPVHSRLGKKPRLFILIPAAEAGPFRPSVERHGAFAT